MNISATNLIKVLCPNLYNSDDLSTYVSIATSLTSRCFFGANYQLAIALRASHIFTLQSNNNSVNNMGNGVISSIKEGDLSINFASINSSKSDDKELLRTSFGVSLNSLIQNTGIGVSVSVSDLVPILCNESE